MPMIAINEDRCKGCSLCVRVCPTHVIEMGKHLNVKGFYPAVVHRRQVHGLQGVRADLPGYLHRGVQVGPERDCAVAQRPVEG